MLDCQSRGSEFDSRASRHTTLRGEDMDIVTILIIILIVLIIVYFAKRV